MREFLFPYENSGYEFYSNLNDCLRKQNVLNKFWNQTFNIYFHHFNQFVIDVPLSMSPVLWSLLLFRSCFLINLYQLCMFTSYILPKVPGRFIIVDANEEHYYTFFLLWRCDPMRVMASSFLRVLDHTQRRTTVDRIPLDKWSARRRDLYLTIHNTYNRQTSMPPMGFEATILAGERP
jgi:hypothetical protein